MPTCVQGHESETDDFCDECGAPITGAPGTGPGGGTGSGSGTGSRGGTGSEAAPSRSEPSPPTPAPGGASSGGASSGGASSGGASSGGGGEVCPRCGTPRSGRFCEEDGYDFLLPSAVPAPTEADPPPSPPARPAGATGWQVVVDADRDYFDRVAAEGGPDIGTVRFPTYYPRLELDLTGGELRVGRRRSGGTSTAPDIDLSGPPLDPGVSHLHAVLLAEPDGSWSVLDPGSSNGTTVNGGHDPIPRDRRVPLGDGDRVHVGAFTTLTLRAVTPPQ